MATEIVMPGRSELDGGMEVVSSMEALRRIEMSKHSETQKRFMTRTVKDGTAFWHDFGDGPICILDVSRFFNEGVDVPLMTALCGYLAKETAEVEADVLLTAVTGGNIITYDIARQRGIDRVVCAKKKKNVIHGQNGFIAEGGYSYTGGFGVELVIGYDRIFPRDRVLIADDFVDTGRMALTLSAMVESSQASVVGFAFGVNKVYARGMEKVQELADQKGIPRENIASFISIMNMNKGLVQFEGFDVGFQLLRQEDN